MKEEQRTYLFGLLEKQFGKMSARERLIAGSIIDEAVNLATKELQAQIEKMKCCRNCKYDGGLVCLYKTDCKNRDKWELAD